MNKKYSSIRTFSEKAVRSLNRPNNFLKIFSLLLILFLLMSIISCGKIPIRKYYVLKYEPDPIEKRVKDVVHPFTVRVKQFDIEKVYESTKMVYSGNAYELQYYYYRLWAVKPAKMLTDILASHLAKSKITNSVIRRLDEGGTPDYELSGMVESIEEFDSDKYWYAHIAFSVSLKRLSDNTVVYTRHFDKRKQVGKHSPEFVVRSLSELIDMTFSEVILDIDNVFNEEKSSYEDYATSPFGLVDSSNNFKLVDSSSVMDSTYDE